MRLVEHSQVLQVFEDLRTVESLLEPAEREIYSGKLVGRPFYMPRALASCCCMGRRNRFPSESMQRLCNAVRTVARVQLGMISLFNSRVPEKDLEELRQHLPEGLLAQLVIGLGSVFEACSSACCTIVCTLTLCTASTQQAVQQQTKRHTTRLAASACSSCRYSSSSSSTA